MNFHFNLIDEDWIPCVGQDGNVCLKSLRQTLLSAHAIREVHAELPPMSASIQMLILAILYRSLFLKNENEWIGCWETGAFKEDDINEYLDKWHSRFDLFDGEHPFYQDALIGLRKEDLKKLKGKDIVSKGVNGLVLHSSSGDAATLFDHSTDDNEPDYSFDEIARLMIMFQGFSLGGMTSAAIPADKFYKDSPHGRAVVFFLQGNNLFETLMLNLIAREDLLQHLDGSGEDRPAWEMDDAYENMRDIPLGIMDFLTWQSRRLCLLPSEKNGKPVVHSLYPAPGLSLSEHFENPFYLISYTDAAGGKLDKRLLRFSESRALWRDSLSILQPRTRKHKPPQALSWVNILRSEGVLEKQIRFHVYGLCTEPGKKKAYFYREEDFIYPLVYLNDQALRDELGICLDLAQAVSQQLYGALNQMAGLYLAFQSDQADGRKADLNDIKHMMAHWDSQAHFWKNLEVPFFQLVNMLPESMNQAKIEWLETLRLQALNAFDRTEIFVGDSIPAMKAASKARRQLLNGLRKVLDTQQKEEE